MVHYDENFFRSIFLSQLFHKLVKHIKFLYLCVYNVYNSYTEPHFCFNVHSSNSLILLILNSNQSLTSQFRATLWFANPLCGWHTLLCSLYTSWRDFFHQSILYTGCWLEEVIFFNWNNKLKIFNRFFFLLHSIWGKVVLKDTIMVIGGPY